MDQETEDRLINQMIGSVAADLTMGVRRLERTQVDDLTIDTTNSYDCGPETAIVDAVQHVRIVERYDSIEEAHKGHNRWVAKVRSPGFDNKVRDVGYKGYGAEDYTLVRRAKLYEPR